jgi:hypothetical protein
MVSYSSFKVIAKLRSFKGNVPSTLSDHDERHTHHTMDSYHMIGHLVQVYEPPRSGKPRNIVVSPAPVRYMALSRDQQSSGRRARSARQHNNTLLIARFCAKRPDMGYRHRSLLHLELRDLLKPPTDRVRSYQA